MQPSLLRPSLCLDVKVVVGSGASLGGSVQIAFHSRPRSLARAERREGDAAGRGGTQGRTCDIVFPYFSLFSRFPLAMRHRYGDEH